MLVAALTGSLLAPQFSFQDGQATLRRGDQVALSSPQEGLWSVATAWEDGWPARWHHAPPTSLTQSGDWQIAKGTLTLPEGKLELSDSYRVEGNLVRCVRRWEWHGQTPLNQVTLSVRWNMHQGQGARPFLPGISYFGNPSGAKTKSCVPIQTMTPGEESFYEEHRYAMPFASLENATHGVALHSIPSMPAGAHKQDQWWTLGLTTRETGHELTLLSGPCASNGQRNVVKARQGTFMAYPDTWLTLRPGMILEKTFFLQAYPVEQPGFGFRHPMEASLKLFQPYSLDGLPTAQEIVDAKLAFANSRWRDGETPGFEMYPDYVQGTHYVMGWCGQAEALGYALQVLDPASAPRVQGALDMLASSPFNERGYLDKYNIAESIRDGTTLPLHYALAPSELLVDKETLEKQFLSLTEAEGVADVEELNALLDKAVELKELMKSPERVEAVAAYVANHFSTNVQPMGFKAFLVAVDREACAFYKKALDRHLPPEASAVVMSAGHNDPEHLKEFHLLEDQEKAIRKAFIAKSGDPQILIVTEKLLTGFDAPILYCLYLDKPMRDHVLLQTIARVNRPYKDADGLVKPLGFVLDFVGIFEKLERALSFDSDVVASVIQNLDVLRQRFEKLMAEDASAYLGYTKGWTDKDKERAIAAFEEKETRVLFFDFYKELQTLYDILSPDAFLRTHIDRFQALTALYALIREAYSPRVYVDRELTDKTKRLVRETTSLYRIDEPTKVHTLGADQLSALRRGDASNISKVLNLNKLIVQAADKDGDSKPFLISIAERAESALQALEDRKITTQQALVEFEQLAEEYVKADEERQQLGLTENAYGVFIVVRQYTDGVTPEQAKQIDDVVERHPEFGWDLDQQRSLRNELYRLVRPWVGSKMVELVNKIMGLVRL